MRMKPSKNEHLPHKKHLPHKNETLSTLNSHCNYSTTHALINLTESIRQTLDEGGFGCVIFTDLQKAFETIDYKILPQKFQYYPASICLFNVNNRNTRKRCKICSKLTIKSPE